MFAYFLSVVIVVAAALALVKAMRLLWSEYKWIFVVLWSAWALLALELPLMILR